MRRKTLVRIHPTAETRRSPSPPLGHSQIDDATFRVPAAIRGTPLDGATRGPPPDDSTSHSTGSSPVEGAASHSLDDSSPEDAVLHPPPIASEGDALKDYMLDTEPLFKKHRSLPDDDSGKRAKSLPSGCGSNTGASDVPRTFERRLLSDACIAYLSQRLEVKQCWREIGLCVGLSAGVLYALQERFSGSNTEVLVYQMLREYERRKANRSVSDLVRAFLLTECYTAADSLTGTAFHKTKDPWSEKPDYHVLSFLTRDSEVLRNWKSLGYYFKLTLSDITNIERENLGNVREMAYSMFLHIHPSINTMDLKQGLRRCRCDAAANRLAKRCPKCHNPRCGRITMEAIF